MFNVLRNSLDKIKGKQRLINSYWDESTNEDVIGFYTRVIANMSDAERCSIFIHNPKADTLWLKTGTDLQKPKIEVPKETSMVGRVLSSGQPLFENDLEHKQGAHKVVEAETGFVTRNALCVPITSLRGEKVTGVIQTINKNGSTSFDDQDLKLLQEVARYLAFSIENIFFGQETLDVTEKILNTMQMIMFGFLGIIAILMLFIFSGNILGVLISLF